MLLSDLGPPTLAMLGFPVLLVNPVLTATGSIAGFASRATVAGVTSVARVPSNSGNTTLGVKADRRCSSSMPRNGGVAAKPRNATWTSNAGLTSNAGNANPAGPSGIACVSC